MIDRDSWRVILATARLRLVPLTAGDADEMVGVLADQALYAFTGGAPLAAATLRARYERLATGVSPDGHQIWANWIVRLEAGGAPIGFVQASVGADGADLAWVIGTAWQGSGYAGEAAAAMAAFLRAAGVTPLTAYVDPRHAASRRTAVHAGLAATGRINADGEEIWSDRPPD